MHEHDSIAAFTRGDPARAAMLRRNLETILERTTDPHLRAVLARTLEGRMSVRQLVRDGAFEQQLDAGMSRFGQFWESLTPAQRAQAVRQGREQEAERRAAAGQEPPPEPEPEVGDTPLLRDDPDERPGSG